MTRCSIARWCADGQQFARLRGVLAALFRRADAFDGRTPRPTRRLVSEAYAGPGGQAGAPGAARARSRGRRARARARARLAGAGRARPGRGGRGRRASGWRAARPRGAARGYNLALAGRTLALRGRGCTRRAAVVVDSPRRRDGRDGRHPEAGARARPRLLSQEGLRPRRAVPDAGGRGEPVVRRRLQHARRHLPRPGAVPEGAARLRGRAADEPRATPTPRSTSPSRTTTPASTARRRRPTATRSPAPARRTASSTASCRASSPTCTPTSATCTSPPGSTTRRSPSTGARSRSARPSSTSARSSRARSATPASGEAAIAEYEEVVRQARATSPARLNLGLSLFAAGPQGGGGRHWRAVLEISPGNRNAEMYLQLAGWRGAPRPPRRCRARPRRYEATMTEPEKTVRLTTLSHGAG